MKTYLWRREYPDVTDEEYAGWVAQVDKALKTTDELLELLERVRRGNLGQS